MLARIGLCALLFVTACAANDEDGATAHVEVFGRSYSSRVEARAALVSRDRYQLALKTTVDSSKTIADDEIYLRFDANFVAPKPTRFELRTLVQLETHSDDFDLEQPLRCNLGADAAPNFLDEPNLYGACLSELRHFHFDLRKLTQRLDGVLHIDRVQNGRLAGRLELRAVGVTAEGEDEEDLAFDPLFYSGIRLELAFDAELTTR